MINIKIEKKTDRNIWIQGERFAYLKFEICHKKLLELLLLLLKKFAQVSRTFSDF